MFSRARLLLLAHVATTVALVSAFGWTFWSVGVPSVFLVLFADGVLRARSGILHPIVTRGPRDARRIALSFDDGPDPDVTPRVLDVLARHGARATFFTIGRSLVAHPELARRIVREGHELGNHSFGHGRWTPFYSVAEQHREIERGERAIADVTGSPTPPLLRPPFGVTSPPFLVAVGERGLRVVAWSLHARDGRGCDPQRTAARILRKIRPGDIVLLHDGHDLPGEQRPACPAVVAGLLDGLGAHAFECVTVSELLVARAPAPVAAEHPLSAA
jgi:peptidoglycan/xylan/chitin deacetylase (PgdA/CDA1 family)